MITKNVTDDTTGLKKAVVTMDVPAVQIVCLRQKESELNTAIKQQLLDVVSELIDKNLT